MQKKETIGTGHVETCTSNAKTTDQQGHSFVCVPIKDLTHEKYSAALGRNLVRIFGKHIDFSSFVFQLYIKLNDHSCISLSQILGEGVGRGEEERERENTLKLIHKT